MASAVDGPAGPAAKPLGGGDRDRALLRLAFGRPLRQTEGLLRSVAALLGLELGIPTTPAFSRRSPVLVSTETLSRAQEGGGPVHVMIDATGLKVFGAGEWLTEKHGA